MIKKAIGFQLFERREGFSMGQQLSDNDKETSDAARNC
jgi:hypothetical protein